MNNEKGIELIKELVVNRFSFHKIEKDLDIANGSLKKAVDGKIRLSDINYRKLQGYFIANVLKMEPDVLSMEKMEEYDQLKIKVSELESENAILKGQLEKLSAKPEPIKETIAAMPTPQEAAQNDEILAQIKVIKDEKCPKERDTPIGRKSWQIDQQNRISELKKQLQ